MYQHVHASTCITPCCGLTRRCYSSSPERASFSRGYVRRQLAASRDTALGGDVSALLQSLRRSLTEGERLAAIAEKWQSAAASMVQTAARKWIARRRRQRLLQETRQVAEWVGSMKAPEEDSESEAESDFEEDFEDESDNENDLELMEK